MTAEEFMQGYARRSGMTAADLYAAGRVVVTCDCDEAECEGWACVPRWVAEDELYNHTIVLPEATDE